MDFPGTLLGRLRLIATFLDNPVLVNIPVVKVVFVPILRRTSDFPVLLGTFPSFLSFTEPVCYFFELLRATAFIPN